MSDRIREFANDGFTFTVVDDGPLDGEIVVLLHGFPQTSKSWDEVSARLNRDGYRTLRFDQRGYAPEARPRGRSAYRLSALVGDVVALIHAAGSPVHVVGHDWGAAVAWGAAANHPSLVRTLTAVSVPHPSAFTRSMLSSFQLLRSYYMLVFQFPWLPEAVARRYPKVFERFLAGSGMAAEGIEQVRADIVVGGALSGGLGWYRALPFGNPNYVGKVSVPTTYVWSTRDVALGRRGAELTERYVTGPYRLEIVDGSHWIPDQQPDRLADMIDERAKAG